jgi:hypothetical protein
MTKSTYFSNLIFSAVLIAVSAATYAQTTSKPAVTATRGDVRMERDEFLKTHKYDEINSDWTPNTPFSSDYSRAEVRAARDKFLSTNRWDEANDDFTPMVETPRNMSTVSPAARKMETMQFIRTHMWDNASSAWVKKPMRAKK